MAICFHHTKVNTETPLAHNVTLEGAGTSGRCDVQGTQQRDIKTNNYDQKNISPQLLWLLTHATE